MTFGEKLKSYRKAAGLTQAQLGAKVHKSAQVISNLERGYTTGLTANDYQAIANSLNIPLSELIEGHQDLNKPAIRNIPYASVPHITYRIPVLGRVAAGEPIYADEDVIGYERIDEKYANDGFDYFALRISGQSMEPSIFDGDTVIVRRQDFIEDGQIAVVLIDGEDATVKEVKKVSDGIMLIAHNPAVFSPRVFTKEEIESKPVQIIGRVIQSIRQF
jgi:repressor LexA